MTQFADVVINDGAATPVAHTFTARRIDAGVAKFQDIASGIAVGFPTILVSLREPVKGSKIPMYKAVLKWIVPKMEVVNASTYNGITPAPTKAYDVTATMEILIPERSVTQDRKDLVAYITNTLGHATFKAIITDLNYVA